MRNQRDCGAGLSGLYATRELRKHFTDVLLVEASAHVGGRIQQVDGLMPWPVELGPEFIHGAKSSLKSLLDEVGCQLRELEWPDHWYFGAERRLVGPGAQDAELERLHALFAGVGAEPYPDPDVSVADWLRVRGASLRMLAIADACYANDFGCSLDQLGLREVITENRRWDSGETYLLLDRSLRHIVEHLARGLDHRLRLNWPVRRIEHGAGGALLHGRAGQQLRCRAAVVTVPLAQLQAGTIAFAPALPAAKAGALARLNMSNAVKVVLVFSRAFWPADFFDVVCTDSFIPEFWTTTYPSAPHRSEPAASDPAPVWHPSQPEHACRAAESSRRQGESSGEPRVAACLVGFAAGRRAEAMSGMSESSIVLRALDQLDSIFGTAQARRPATAAFLRAHLADWSRVPHIGGAYSYPSLHARVGDREALAAPVGGALFFAGEATHAAVNPCLQAALETGARAAAQVAAALQRTLSSL
ncbi:hypothetical protein WJX81_001999 [Elliptochloris bilobata]|uniref:Amine oxidase domain-containing protein n=1 Tax=Elliptochloris bilobata TaxID=381761 RepID=A0AAW1QNJ6_9CHLO